MKCKYIMILSILCSLSVYSQEYTMEKLLILKEEGRISGEDFNILKAELDKRNISEESLYDLFINSKLVSRTYKIRTKDNKNFLPVKEFFKYIGFLNYKESENELVLSLGSTLKEVKIKLKENDSVFKEKNEIYLESSKFSEIFSEYYDINSKGLVVRMNLAFDTPKEIIQLLDVSKQKLLRKNNENELVFTSKRKLFDLGYTRVELGQSFEKKAGEKTYKDSWDGKLEYQGGLLYGQITADYDLREKEMGTVKLEYNDIYKGHDLTIENKGGTHREWGLLIQKDNGYYETIGAQIVIREKVPIGSRAELLYMGSSIEIQDAENGVVEFNNPIIRTDRTYVIRVYEPNGTIYEKEIKTTEDFNLQKKNDFEYKVRIDENNQFGKDKYTSDIDVFYGFTDNLTLGVGYSRDIEDLEDNKKGTYLDKAKAEIVYGGTYNGLSYIFNLSGEQTLNNTEFFNIPARQTMSLKDRNSYKYLNQFSYEKWKLTYEHEEFGKAEENKDRDKTELKYDVSKNVQLGYNYEIERKRYEEDEKTEEVTIDTDYSWNNFLFSAGASFNTRNTEENKYRASVYYNGWERLSARLENEWTREKENTNANGKYENVYTTRLKLYNNNFGGFVDFSSELSYSNKDKEMVTFKFAVKLDNWLEIDTSLSDDGAQKHRIGIDRVFDLKNPTVRLDSIDNSRINVITFIDGNNNDLYDLGEERIPGVEVKIGNMEITTGENGEGMFYGIGNGLIYDMNVTIKKPSFTLGNNKIRIKSNFSSTIDAHIPIKPMLTLSGSVELDIGLELEPEERAAFFNDLIVELKNLDGEVIETAAPDNEGLFDMSGLYPKDYYIEVTYIGTKYDLRTIKEEILLSYSKENSINTVLLKISNNNIAINVLNPEKNVAKLGR